MRPLAAALIALTSVPGASIAQSTSILIRSSTHIGTSEAIVVNLPTRLYAYDEPDALDLPWDAEAAKALIPYRW